MGVQCVWPLGVLPDAGHAATTVGCQACFHFYAMFVSLHDLHRIARACRRADRPAGGTSSRNRGPESLCMYVCAPCMVQVRQMVVSCPAILAEKPLEFQRKVDFLRQVCVQSLLQALLWLLGASCGVGATRAGCVTPAMFGDKQTLHSALHIALLAPCASLASDQRGFQHLWQ